MISIVQMQKGKKMRLIDFDKIPFLAIPIAPVVKGESVHYEQGALKEWFDGTQDVEAVPLDRIKEAREEIADRIDNYPDRNTSEYEDCLAIIDELIAEVEGTNETD